MNSSSEIMVTVICKTYNHEKYIRDALEGFVKQKTTFAYEVIVHDDASTDGTQEIVKEYEKRYPEIFNNVYQTENQMSQGVRTMPYLLTLARGKYIATCEGDDFWTDPYKLQKQFDELEKHPECSMCVHEVQCCSEDGTLNGKVIPSEEYKISKSGVIDEMGLAQSLWVRGRYPFQTSSYFYRRSIWDIELDYPRDRGVLLRAFIQGSFYYINKPMSTYRMFSIGSWNSMMRVGG